MDRFQDSSCIHFLSAAVLRYFEVGLPWMQVLHQQTGRMGRGLVAVSIALAVALGSAAAKYGMDRAAATAPTDPEYWRIKQGMPMGEAHAAINPAASRH